MRLIKKLWKVLNSGYTYNINKEILLEYIMREIAFSKENNLELIAEFYIYDDKKYHITLLNKKEAISYCCNDRCYGNMEQFMVEVVSMFSENFKLELIYSDDEFLKPYLGK